MYFNRILFISLGIVGLIASNRADESNCESDTKVCGADGKTYANSCALEDAGMELAHEGECDKLGTGYRPDLILKSKLVKNPDEGVQKKLVKHFNPVTGKWEYVMEIYPTIVVTPTFKNFTGTEDKDHGKKDEKTAKTDLSKSHPPVSKKLSLTKKGDAGLRGVLTKNVTAKVPPVTTTHTTKLSHSGSKSSLSKTPTKPVKLTLPKLPSKNKTHPLEKETGSKKTAKTMNLTAKVTPATKKTAKTMNLTAKVSPVTKKNHTSKLKSHPGHHGVKSSLSKHPSKLAKLTQPLQQPDNKTPPLQSQVTSPELPSKYAKVFTELKPPCQKTEQVKPDNELYPGWYYMKMFFVVDNNKL